MAICPKKLAHQLLNLGYPFDSVALVMILYTTKFRSIMKLPFCTRWNNLIPRCVLFICIFSLSTIHAQVSIQTVVQDNFSVNAGWEFSPSSSSSSNGDLPRWVIASAIGNPANSLYITSDTLLSNTYQTPALARAKRTLVLPHAAIPTNVTFQVRFRGVEGELLSDYLNCWAILEEDWPEIDSLTSIEALEDHLFVPLLLHYNAPEELETYPWVDFEMSLPQSWNGSSIILVFEFVANSLEPLNPAPAIDNLRVSIPICNAVTGINITQLTDSSAYLTFNAFSGVDYVVYLNNEVYDTVNGPLLLYPLEANTPYTLQVRALCEEGFISVLSGAYNFRTKCIITDSFFEDFETSSSQQILPFCMERVGTVGFLGMGPVFNGSGASISMGGQVTVQCQGLDNIGAGTHQLRLSLTTATPTNFETSFQVGYLAEPGNALSMLIYAAVLIPPNSSQFANYYVRFPEGIDIQQIILRPGYATGTGAPVTILVSEVSWEEIEGCEGPTSFTISAVTSSSFTIHIQDEEPLSSAYLIRLNEEQYVTALDIVWTVEGLSSGTYYSVEVAAYCYQIDVNAFLPPIEIFTACANLYYTYGGHCFDFDEQGDCWVYNQGDEINWFSNGGGMVHESSSQELEHDLLISPRLFVNDNSVLRFYYRSFAPNTQVRVLLSHTDTHIASFSQVLFQDAPSNPHDGEYANILLNEYANQLVYLAFEVRSLSGTSTYFAIEDICLDVCHAEAGFDQEITICTNWDTINLLDYVEVINPSGSFIGLEQVFDQVYVASSDLDQAQYLFYYQVDGFCTNDTLAVELTVSRQNAGLDTNFSSCLNQPIHLQTLVTSWAKQDGNIYSPTGVYTVGETYTTGKFELIETLQYVIYDSFCGIDTAVYIIAVDSSCDYLSIQTHPDFSLEIFPNPTFESVQIHFSHPVLEFQLYLVDVEGRVIQREYEQIEQGQYRIEMRDLHAGIYFLKLELSDRVFVYSVVKQ